MPKLGIGRPCNHDPDVGAEQARICAWSTSVESHSRKCNFFAQTSSSHARCKELNDLLGIDTPPWDSQPCRAKLKELSKLIRAGEPRMEAKRFRTGHDDDM